MGRIRTLSRPHGRPRFRSGNSGARARWWWRHGAVGGSCCQQCSCTFRSRQKTLLLPHIFALMLQLLSELVYLCLVTLTFRYHRYHIRYGIVYPLYVFFIKSMILNGIFRISALISSISDFRLFKLSLVLSHNCKYATSSFDIASSQSRTLPSLTWLVCISWYARLVSEFWAECKSSAVRFPISPAACPAALLGSAAELSTASWSLSFLIRRPSHLTHRHALLYSRIRWLPNFDIEIPGSLPHRLTDRI